jgi:iron complex outermembrane receptor protein
LFDIKIGGDISTYSGRYGTAYGLFESTLAYRDLEHGGFQWTSSWTGNTYQDGYIPEGVFEPGNIVKMKTSTGQVKNNDVSGRTLIKKPTNKGWSNQCMALGGIGRTIHGEVV